MNLSCKKVSIKDIANKAGVSTSLVSFVLNGKGKEHRVGEEATKLILQLAKEMDYQPNIAAKSLRSGKSGVIGVVVSDISNPFFAQIARGIEDIAGEYGFTVFFGSSDEDSEKMRKIASGLINRGVDGLIIVPCQNSKKTVEELINCKIPLVLFDRYFLDLEASYVSLNNFKATFDATLHLINSGYSGISLVAYDANLIHMQERIRGYKEAMSVSGLTSATNVGYVSQDNLNKSVPKVLKKLLHSDTDALIFATNTLSLSCLHYINDNHILVPDKIGVVGFDGSEAFDLFYSPLTYYLQPIDILAKKAVEVLLEKIDKKNISIQNIQIEGELIIRSSSLKR